MASEVINIDVPEYLRVAFIDKGKETGALASGFE